MRILLAEDNERLSELVVQGLKAAGFVTDAFTTIADAEAAVGAVPYQAMVLDVGLPDGNGIELLRRLRAQGNSTPILVLTARDGVSDRVDGLNSGADDYMMKPFAMEELVARLRALLRRPGGALGVMLGCGDLSFDTVGREVRVRGELVPMPRREIDMLEQLLRRAGRVVAKRALEEGLYGFEDDVSSNTVEVLVSRLRKRLQQAAASVTVHTLRGIGYMLAESSPDLDGGA